MPRTAETLLLADASSLIAELRKASAAVKAYQAETVGANGAIVKSNDTAAASTAKAAAAHKKAMAEAGKVSRDVVLGFAAVAAGSVDMALKMEHAAGRIAASAGISVDAGKAIEEQFKKTAGSAIFSADELGEAYAKVAGELGTVRGRALNSAEALKVMNAAQDLAEAGGGELKGTTEALAKVMLVYRLNATQAAEASDILFTASKKTGLSVEEVAAAVDKIQGRLGILGVKLKESAGLLDDFVKHGIQGRESLAALNGVFNTLVNGGKKVDEMTTKLGIHVFDNTGKFVGLKSVIEQLQPALSQYTEHSQLLITKVLFGSTANKKLLDIIHEGPAAFQAATDAVSQHGTASEAAAKHSETFAGQLEKLKVSLKDAAGGFGELLIPAVKAAATALDDTIKFFKSNETAAKALAVVLSTVLGGALTVFAYTKAVAFVEASKSMVEAMAAIGVKVGVLAGTVATEDGAIVASNAAVGASWLAWLGPIALVAGAVAGLNAILPSGSKIQNLLGGNQPGESGKEGEVFAKQHGGFGHGAAQRSYLEKLGLPGKVAAGLAGNFQNEGVATDTGKEGLGVGQWTEGRRSELEAFARSTHRKPTDEGAQLEFAAKELKGPYRSALGAAERAKSPQEAALILAKQYERPASATAHYERREKSAAEAYGSQELPSEASTKATAKALKEHESAAKKLAAEYVSPFASATGLTRSRTDQGVDFSFGGKLGAVGAGKIVAIRQDPGGFGTEIVQQLSGGSHKGQYVYYGLETGATLATQAGATVRTGQQIGVGRGSGGVELGFARDASGVPITPFAPGASHSTPTAGGEAFSKFLASIGKTGSSLQVASSIFEKAASHLTLSVGQMGAVLGLSSHAESAHVKATADVGEAEGLGAAWSHARTGQARRARKLGTAGGNSDAERIDWQDKATAEAQKKYYAMAVKEIKAEIVAFSKLRKKFLSFAKHATGNAKKEALTQAATYDGKIKGAQKEAEQLGGHIAEADANIENAEAATAALPGEIQGADLSAYQAANSKVDAEVRAGIKTEQQGKEGKEANARTALGGGFGALSSEGTLQVQGDLREFSGAITAAASAVEEMTRAALQHAQAIDGILSAENGSLAKSLADVISGQIAGTSEGARTPGTAGMAARY